MLYQQIDDKLDEKRDWAWRRQQSLPRRYKRLSKKVNTALEMGAKTTQRVKVLK